MNTLIDNSNLAVPDTPAQEIRTLESKRLLNEFHRALDSGQASEDELIQMTLQIGAANYQAIDSQESVTARLVADFTQANTFPEFQRDLFQRTARKIQMSADGALYIELQNGKIIPERT